MKIVTKVKMTFYSYGGWELGGPGRMTVVDGADSMFQFQLVRGDDGTNHSWKMKWG
jgi:hypothetical protein